eukprot:6491252-Amphidinium_carterae.2
MWKIRCGLGPAEVPARVLSDFVRDFDMEHERPIGKDTISSVRDAFAEVLLRLACVLILLNRQHVSMLGADASAVVLSHVHDEASMRIRSVTSETIGVQARGMSTKARARQYTLHYCVVLSWRWVQNNVMNAAFITPLGVHNVTVWLELQPLADKSANTIAHALRLATDAVLSAAVEARKPEQPALRVLHAITG